MWRAAGRNRRVWALAKARPALAPRASKPAVNVCIAFWTSDLTRNAPSPDAAIMLLPEASVAPTGAAVDHRWATPAAG